MRKTLFGTAIIALAAVAPLTAQDPGAGMASMNGSWIVSLGGGATLPVGDASDIFKTGWHGHATFGGPAAASRRMRTRQTDATPGGTHHGNRKA